VKSATSPANPRQSERYDVGATWFFRRRIGVQLAWSKTESRLPLETVTDVEAVTLQLIGRL